MSFSRVRVRVPHPESLPERCVCVCVCVNRSVVSDSFATVWTVARQAPLSMGFSRQKHRSGLPCPPPGDLPDPGTKPVSPTLAGRFFTTEPPGKPPRLVYLERNEVSQSPVGDAGDVISMDHEELQLRQSGKRRFRQSLYAIKPKKEKKKMESHFWKKKKNHWGCPNRKEQLFLSKQERATLFLSMLNENPKKNICVGMKIRSALPITGHSPRVFNPLQTANRQRRP